MLTITEPIVYIIFKKEVEGLESVLRVAAWVKLPEYRERIFIRTYISKTAIKYARISLDDMLIREARNFAIENPPETQPST